MAASNASSAGPSTHEPSSFTAVSLPNEFYVTVDLYLSKMAAAARKFQIPRRKTEKRDSMKPSASSGDLHQRKIKEKASWLGLSRSSNNAEQWRSATCKLVEEDEGCLLNVYIDDTALYQSVYVHKLYHTDIRRVHHSLFDRKDCLGIFCTSDQTWNPTAFTEPLYIHFSDTEILNTWVVLLRSYAVPEVYGRWLSARDGGLYRMWRQVELVCLQGRNLGVSRYAGDDSNSADAESRSEGDSIDLDIYCEFWVNSIFSGKTTVKKGLASPDWHEKFAFTDLPPFENLEILVYREKRLVKPILIGCTLIPLMNFRRGEYVEGWFPVLGGQGHNGVVMGDMRLKLKVDEEIILPYSMYTDMLKTLQSKNVLDWVAELDSKLEIRNISDHIIAIAKAKSILMKDIMELADREVDGTPQSHGTLFRGNTVFTKTMEIFMVTQGTAFLEASVGSVIRRLCSERVSIEIDPARSHKKNVDKQAELLVSWCQEFWKSIYDARKHCPDDMRKLFCHIRQLIESRYGTGESRNAELPWQGVSSFLFLRFFVPAILHPHLFGIWPGLTEDPVQRTLTLIAKVMQSLANLNTNLQKEQYMRPVQEFLTNGSKGMVDYINSVSSADSSHVESLPSQVLDRHEKVRIMNALHQRHSKAPVLHREAIPLLPYMVDLPKHLAVVTSIVVRHTRRRLPTRTGEATERTLDEFCSSCLQVEEQALLRVSQLAARRRPHHVPSPKSISSVQSPASSPRQLVHKTSLPNKLRSKRSRRPSTAPDPDAQTKEASDDVSAPAMPTGRVLNRTVTSPPSSFANALEAIEPQSLPSPRPPFMHHPRSTSTDSALSRKQYASSSRTPSMSGGFPCDIPSDQHDESLRKPRGLLRGILRK